VSADCKSNADSVVNTDGNGEANINTPDNRHA
jgi:hypothetical protein